MDGLISHVLDLIQTSRVHSARRIAVSDDEMPPIPGVAGVDFPVLTEIPQTGFDCAAQDFPGIYADMDTDCQVSTVRRKKFFVRCCEKFFPSVP